jgi:hypothetical protein
MTPEKIGKFDLILQCGNLEYILNAGENEEKIYTKYSSIIKTLLKNNGTYFITCCHFNEKFFNSSWQSFDYYLHTYFLWAGNDGCYPSNKYGFSKYANDVGLKTIYHEDRTNDYYITMAVVFSYFQCYNRSCVTSFSLLSLIDALFKTIAGPYFIHTYLCYLSTNDPNWTPFIWEFAPQNKNGKWVPPFTLQYIMFQK